MKIFDLFRRSFLSHSGTPQRYDFDPENSGRYRKGSGNNPNQMHNNVTMVDNVQKLKDKGLSEREIRDALGLSSTEYRKLNGISSAQKRAIEDAKIFHLRNDKNWGYTAIAKEVYGDAKYESKVRSRLEGKTQARRKQTEDVMRIIKDEADKYGWVDIGKGSESALGISPTRLSTAAKELEEMHGYHVDYVYVTQKGTGKKTNIKYIAKPGVTKQEVYKNIDGGGLLGGIKVIDANNNKTALGIEKPVSVSSNRVLVKRLETHGQEKDGTIEIRRNVPDLSLGKSNYAQVRIAVDDTHYMKGMALYKDDSNFPPGIDIIYNTKYASDIPEFGKKGNTVLKPLKKDPDNPFGSTLKIEDGKIVGQKYYIDKDGKQKLSPINIVREEGDWDTWSKTLASQFLSKQPKSLVKQQLDLTYKQKKEEYDEIMSLTNPIIKQKLLNEFADSCDSDAVHLKAAALPRQASKVILPFNSLGDTEVYAPTFEDGEEVILVRYPHGGPFESPRLTVNNSNKEAKKTIGQATDAIGINYKVAQQLSGADFDGDSVVVIPTRGQNIRTKPPFEGLKSFDTEQYRIPDYLSEDEKNSLRIKDGTQRQMGIITNLITDMTIQGASNAELERAVRHSMVIIDADKHDLDYKRSYRENNIAQLKREYQEGGGVATLISRAKSQTHIPDRTEAYSTRDLSPEQIKAWNRGEKVYKETGKVNKHPKDEKDLIKVYGKKNLKAYKGEWHYMDENGKIFNTGRKVEYVEEPKTIRSTKMADTKDAMTLVSKTQTGIELEYAKYANSLKALGNDARKEARTIKTYEVNKSAKKVYKDEIESLNAKLKIAEANKPYERKAQAISDAIIKSKLEDNPELRWDDDARKKMEQQSLIQARNMTGASKKDSAVKITPSEWEAIQAHAISASMLREIANNTDEDRLKEYAMPRKDKSLTPSQENKIKSYSQAGLTISEIAEALGVSASTVNQYLKES